MTNHRPRVRYQRTCSGALGAGPFATKWYCVRLASSVHDKLMQFLGCLWAWGDFSDAGCGSFAELCRVPRSESLRAWKGFTWQATNNYTPLFPLYSIIFAPLISRSWAFVNKQGRLPCWPQHNKTLFFSDMINKTRPCRLNIFIRPIFHFFIGKSQLWAQVEGLSWTQAGRQVPVSSLRDVLQLCGYWKSSFEKRDIDWQIQGMWAVALEVSAVIPLLPFPLSPTPFYHALPSDILNENIFPTWDAMRTKPPCVRGTLLRNPRVSSSRVLLHLWKTVKNLPPTLWQLLRIHVDRCSTYFNLQDGKVHVFIFFRSKVQD